MASTPPTPSEPHRLEAQRRANRDSAAALGLTPYGSREDGLLSLAGAAARYDQAADEDQKARGKEPGFADHRPRVRVAGRVVLSRDNGRLIWLNLQDHTGTLQVAVSQRDCPGFDLAKLTDLGDVVIAEGPLVRTRTGETTIWAAALLPAAKCLEPPPEKHAGLTDVELRYRRRYVDLWANPHTLRVFEMRSRLVAELRRLMDARGYLEVETPMLQVLAGGAAARPFKTHMNALDMPLYLRIAPELYLKRLLVGGLPRVYEINRNFRNEGLDKQHNPEFTMLEAYHAFGNVQTVMELTESAIRHLARFLSSPPPRPAGEVDSSRRDEDGGGPTGSSGHASAQGLPFGDLLIDYEAPFARVPYAELFERALGFPTTNVQRARDEARTRRLIPDDRAKSMDDALVINELFEEAAEPTLDPARPTFITDYPAVLSPLTRARPDNPAIAERADLFIGGMEIAPHYTELNDPDVQAARFREQLAGLDDEESTFRTFDEDFIRALRVGMPPAGGMGLGIDRLMMLLTNQRTIRDVILFPLMRPE
ncbi:MAG: lysine--tRNA ligase [Phycisphaerales bacterium]|nr:lysine--tRNA ligase [Phycisphaerales bacterium]